MTRHPRMNDVRTMKTKFLKKELERASADFWTWQITGVKMGYQIEDYIDALIEELQNRGQDDG